MRAEELDVIADPTVNPTRLAEAVRRLGRAAEPPSFWVAIANDSTYPPAHRRTAVLQLFIRHVHPGTTLGQLAAMLEGTPWLERGDVAVVEDIGGFGGVTPGHDRTVFRIAVLPNVDAGAFVYLAVEGQLDAHAFVATLHGSEVAADVRIVDGATLPTDGIDAY